MAIPALSAAAITSSSLIDPPGWITALIPIFISSLNPSAKGKKASDAATLPFISFAKNDNIVEKIYESIKNNNNQPIVAFS